MHIFHWPTANFRAEALTTADVVPNDDQDLLFVRNLRKSSVWSSWSIDRVYYIGQPSIVSHTYV
uniref:Uncharacterized protein n=1 Tax=Romanomermis culicivorax TaxID=13658 RepID=A0A915JD85_ROMCU